MSVATAAAISDDGSLIALLVEPGKENSPFRLHPGELRRYFEGWEILHDREGRDAWHHAVAEVVARRPQDTC